MNDESKSLNEMLEPEVDEGEIFSERRLVRLDYLKAFLIGAIMVAVLYFWRSTGGSRSTAFYLIDSTFITGVVLAGFGAITIINKAGFYDIAQFGLRQVMSGRAFGITRKESKLPKDLYEFKKRQRYRRLARWHWFFAGAFYIIISFIIIVLNN